MLISCEISLAGFLEQTGYSDQVRGIGVAIPGHYTKDAPEKILTNNASWKISTSEKSPNALTSRSIFPTMLLYDESRISFLYET